METSYKYLSSIMRAGKDIFLSEIQQCSFLRRVSIFFGYLSSIFPGWEACYEYLSSVSRPVQVSTTQKKQYLSKLSFSGIFFFAFRDLRPPAFPANENGRVD